MTGEVKRIIVTKAYGFIVAEDKDYFFHKADYEDLWTDLVDDLEQRQTIKVEFEPKKTDKGLRATKVSRLYD
jgi:cold shock CspA family protein